jgi:cytoskeletal protein RodZ
MTEDGETEQQLPLPVSAGERLRAAREARGMSLAALAGVTRITQRHLALIETGDFAALPGRTYVVGFARSYAKAVGLDQDAIANQVREELAGIEMPGPTRLAVSFEPGDPARVPSARLAWLSLLAALLLFGAGSVFVWSSYFAPAGDLPWPEESAQPAAGAASAPAPAAAAPVAAGQVTFTALAPDIWVKFYDHAGRQLMQKQMALGETYTVPGDAQGPLLWTGRPDALAITIGGKPVAKLAEQQVTMKDVPVTAAALLARVPAPSASPTATAPPAASPAASPTG